MLATSSLKRFYHAIIGRGPLVSEEDRQIRSIMEVKGPATVPETEEGWLTPDVQVVLWFVLLCCLMEGIVSGYNWWRAPGSSVVENRRTREKIGHEDGPNGGSKGEEEGEDNKDYEDDEANIPVL